MKKKLGLYIHMPFCVKKCDYCDFYSIVGFQDYKRYADTLLLQMEDYSKLTEGYEVDTVFIGGGTPTLMPAKYLVDVIYGIYSNFDVTSDAEITIEANPATADKKMFKKLLKSGVNRLSLGLQSSNGNELEKLTRIHTYQDFEIAYYEARSAGFENINADIMYGIPDQTLHSLNISIEKALDLYPDHISLYGLKVEDGTPLSKYSDQLTLPDEDTEYEMYKSSVDFLSSHGYEQYEISNFAANGNKCRHNMKYWNCDEYIGIGPASHSYFKDKRYSIEKDISKFMDAMEYVDSSKKIIENESIVDERGKLNEYIMLRLRLNEGISGEVFTGKFGRDFGKMFENKLPLYLENGFMKYTNGIYALTVKGMYVSNYILSDILDF